MNLTFYNNKGYKLSAVIDQPEGKPPFPTVIFSHGFDSSKDSPRTVPIAKELQKNGISAFRFDYTGHGDSEGSKQESTPVQQLLDLEAAIDQVKISNHVSNTQIALHGSSSGALVALMEAEKHDYGAILLRAPRVDSFYPDVKEKACRIDTPVYAVQGEFDPMLTETQKFLGELGVRRKMAIINEADHLFSQPEQYEKVKKITVAWLTQALKR